MNSFFSQCQLKKKNGNSSIIHYKHELEQKVEAPIFLFAPLINIFFEFEIALLCTFQFSLWSHLSLSLARALGSDSCKLLMHCSMFQQNAISITMYGTECTLNYKLQTHNSVLCRDLKRDHLCSILIWTESAYI